MSRSGEASTCVPQTFIQTQIPLGTEGEHPSARAFTEHPLTALHGRLWFRCYQGNLNAALFIEFLEALLHDISKKIVLIIDRHPAHRAASVLRFLRKHEDRLSVHFLPAYAPELNPDEHAWSAVKRLFRTDPLDPDEDIEGAVSAVMRKIKDDRAWVKSFFDHPEVAYVKEALGW